MCTCKYMLYIYTLGHEPPELMHLATPAPEVPAPLSSSLSLCAEIDSCKTTS